MKHVQSDRRALGLILSVVALACAFAWSGGLGRGPDPELALAESSAGAARFADPEPGDVANLRLAEGSGMHPQLGPRKTAGEVAVEPREASASRDPVAAPAWDDVEEKFRDIIRVTEAERENMLESLLGGPVVPTEEWLRERIGVDVSEATLAEAWLLVNERNLAIQWESRQYYDLLARKVEEKWDSGSYRKAQGELPPDPEATSGYYITQVAHNGWLASVTVGAEDGSELEGEYQRLRGLIRDRNRALISLANGG